VTVDIDDVRLHGDFRSAAGIPVMGISWRLADGGGRNVGDKATFVKRAPGAIRIRALGRASGREVRG
jgi:hypothetical protein